MSGPEMHVRVCPGGPTAVGLGNDIYARLRERVGDALDDEQWQTVADALSEAMNAGMRVGTGELAASLIEQGWPLTIDFDEPGAQTREEGA